jgi:hypothetical protein
VGVFSLTMSDEQLLGALSGALETLFPGLVITAQIQSRLWYELQEALARFRSDLSEGIAPKSPRFLTHLAELASLSTRVYFGSVNPTAIPEAVRATILNFFVYYKYPIDLDAPQLAVDDPVPP